MSSVLLGLLITAALMWVAARTALGLPLMPWLLYDAEECLFRSIGKLDAIAARPLFLRLTVGDPLAAIFTATFWTYGLWLLGFPVGSGVYWAALGTGTVLLVATRVWARRRKAS